MNSKALKRTLAGIGLALTGSILGMQSAHAVLIDQWTFVNNSTFSAFSPEDTIPAGVEGSIPNAVLGGSTLLEWGEATGNAPPGNTEPSSLQIANAGFFTDTLDTDGVDQVLDLSLTHNNFEITGQDLVSATLTSAGQLTALNPATGDVVAVPVVAEIAFQETVNFPVSGVCEDGTTPVPANGCPDVFVVTSINGETPVDPVQFNFIVDDFLYTATLDFVGVATLNDDQCDVVGAGTGCLGFTTEEGQANTLDIFLSLDARQIPEPGSLALLGAGLAGLGFMRRRSKKKGAA